MQSTKDHEVNDIYIIQIGSLSEFFSGKPIKVETVLHLVELDFRLIMGVHMNRQRKISVIGRLVAEKRLP